MTGWFGRAAIVVLVVWPAGGAGAATCPSPDAAPVVELIRDDGKIRYDHTKSRKKIKAMFSKRNTGKKRAKLITMGLTVAEFAYSFGTRIAYGKVGDFKYCAFLKKAEIRVGFPKVTVYIDRQYPKRSCEYKAILRHENKHVGINSRAMEKYTPKIRKRIVDTLKKRPWIVARTEKKAKKSYSDLLSKRLKPLIRAMNRERDRAHDKLDTLKSYQATRASCTNW